MQKHRVNITDNVAVPCSYWVVIRYGSSLMTVTLITIAPQFKPSPKAVMWYRWKRRSSTHHQLCHICEMIHMSVQATKQNVSLTSTSPASTSIYESEKFLLATLSLAAMIHHKGPLINKVIYMHQHSWSALNWPFMVETGRMEDGKWGESMGPHFQVDCGL